MKNNIFRKQVLTSILAFSVLAIFSSCQKEVITEENSSFRNPDMKAAATVTIENTKEVSFALDYFIDCANDGAGEMVHFSGTLHILQHLVVNGNSFQFKSHFQPQGIKGVGDVTGDVYNATGVTQEVETGKFINGSYSYSYINNFRLIGPGTGNNLLAHEVFHITFNANGDISSEKDLISFECK